MNNVDCLVVGAGPAGLMATLYLRRYLREVLLADAGNSRALGIDWSLNVTGFPEGISGHGLLQRLRAQLHATGGRVVASEVQQVGRQADGRFVAIVDGRPVVASHLLLATGVVDKLPPLPGLRALQRKGLLRHCPICDGYEHRGQRIAVLGDSAHAEEEARFIAHYSPHVAVVDPDTVASAEVLPDGGVRLIDHDRSCQDFDVLYAALGVCPQAQLASALGAQTDDGGNLVVDDDCRTTVSGLYAAGDVVAGLDQIAVAASQGVIAATSIHNALMREQRKAGASPARQTAHTVPG